MPHDHDNNKAQKAAQAELARNTAEDEAMVVAASGATTEGDQYLYEALQRSSGGRNTSPAAAAALANAAANAKSSISNVQQNETARVATETTDRQAATQREEGGQQGHGLSGDVQELLNKSEGKAGRTF